MWRLLADVNFNGDILRGVLLRRPDLDLVRGQDLGLDGVEDSDVLAFAANENRILLTHDRADLPNFAFDRLAAGEAMPGVFVLHGRFPIGEAIQVILTMIECSEPSEWNGRVVSLPL